MIIENACIRYSVIMTYLLSVANLKTSSLVFSFLFGLLTVQFSHGQEDNERIARMYQMVQSMATTKLVSDDDLKPNTAYE